MENTQQPANTKLTVTIESEKERLLRDMQRSDKEKFRLFVEMLHVNAVFAKASITHK